MRWERRAQEADGTGRRRGGRSACDGSERARPAKAAGAKERTVRRGRRRRTAAGDGDVAAAGPRQRFWEHEPGRAMTNGLGRACCPLANGDEPRQRHTETRRARPLVELLSRAERHGARPVKTAKIRTSGSLLICWLPQLKSALSNVLHWFGVRVIQIDHHVQYLALVSQHPV